MTEPHDPQHDVPADLAHRLADPALWVDVPADVEDAVIDAIAVEAAAERASSAASGGRTAQRTPAWAFGTAAAALAGLALAAVVLLLGTDDEQLAVALVGTELAPDAHGDATFETTDRGLRIVIDIDDLPPAPDGRYYQGWMRSDDDAVSVGTFHLRNGDGPIELWCGVDDPSFDTFSVTVQDERGGPASSGDVVLVGRLTEPAVRDDP